MSSIDPPPVPEWQSNPYAAPESPIGGEVVELDDTMGEAERIRRKYLVYESSVKSIGSLHLMVIFAGTGILLTMVFNGEFLGDNRLLTFIIAGFYALMTAASIILGIGILKLREWARWTDITLWGLGLFFLLTGTVLGTAVGAMEWPQLIVPGVLMVLTVFILSQLLSSKSTMVFSERYRTIIAQTPHIKHRPRISKSRPSFIVKFLVGLLLLVILTIVVLSILDVLGILDALDRL